MAFGAVEHERRRDLTVPKRISIGMAGLFPFEVLGMALPTLRALIGFRDSGLLGGGFGRHVSLPRAVTRLAVHAGERHLSLVTCLACRLFSICLALGKDCDGDLPGARGWGLVRVTVAHGEGGYVLAWLFGHEPGKLHVRGDFAWGRAKLGGYVDHSAGSVLMLQLPGPAELALVPVMVLAVGVGSVAARVIQLRRVGIAVDAESGQVHSVACSHNG